MRKNRVIEQNRCYHLVNRLAHRADFDQAEFDKALASFSKRERRMGGRGGSAS